MRSFARAFSSSRRAPPIQASNWCSAMVSSKVTACAALRESVSGLRRRTVPFWMDASTLPMTNGSPISAKRLSRKAMTSGKLCPVSTCTILNGSLLGLSLNLKALSAKCNTTIESLPPENNSAGLLHSAATSRRMWMDSDSSQSRWAELNCWLKSMG